MIVQYALTIERQISTLDSTMTKKATYWSFNLRHMLVVVSAALILLFCSCSERKAELETKIKMKDLIMAAHSAFWGGPFPAAYNQDATGKPLLSWRVQLLPHFNVKYKWLYDQFYLLSLALPTNWS